MNKPAPSISAAASAASSKYHQSDKTRMTDDEAEDLYVRKWLINAMCIYPIMSKALISQTMQGLRMKSDSAAWQTELEKLVTEGLVYKYRKQTTTITGRQQYLTLYRLTAQASIFIVQHLPNQDPHAASRIHMMFAPSAEADPEAHLKAMSEIPDLSPYIDASDEELNALDPDGHDNIADLQKMYAPGISVLQSENGVTQVVTDPVELSNDVDGPEMSAEDLEDLEEDEVSPDFWEDDD